jgi:tRNA-modifying protein YgfZ
VGGGALLLVEAGAGDSLAAHLATAGAHLLTPGDYEIWRVEQGLPGPHGELIEDFTPLEAALSEAVSSEKGCYTGQEIIARQITYDKVTRGLVGLRLRGPAASGDSVEVEGKRAGAITSAVESPLLGPIALAVLKRPHNVPGTPVTVIHDEQPRHGTVAALPFA